ncbi:DUF397 domain-containing protein [Kitasatospora brasiliensis]|uniref:DUF397 domain-containing protein n=1 Tax=Kitasatospora brasiliensis TaxID=3058040 RepID=UPI0029307601|nr:DUF397 domain-containing protein [Kitasatospora sp. K002]
MSIVPNSTTLQVAWRKSSYSGGNGDCVEVAAAGSVIYIRDSKDPEGPALAITPETYALLIRTVAADDFDFGTV